VVPHLAVESRDLDYLEGVREAAKGRRDRLNNVTLPQTKLEDTISCGAVKISGDRTTLNDVVASRDTFDFWFNIVTP
jgi:alkyl sulfatase BDS1-like metallo-beta-lactamase superfamily hydrolase